MSCERNVRALLEAACVQRTMKSGFSAAAKVTGITKPASKSILDLRMQAGSLQLPPIFSKIRLVVRHNTLQSFPPTKILLQQVTISDGWDSTGWQEPVLGVS